MIEFTAEQERRAMRRDCRVWTELMVQAWYESDYPQATDYSADVLVSDLRWIYFTCHDGKVQDIAFISLLGLIVLRARMLNCSVENIVAFVDYFLIHARVDNVNYAQASIEIYLEEIGQYGA